MFILTLFQYLTFKNFYKPLFFNFFEFMKINIYINIYAEISSFICFKTINLGFKYLLFSVLYYVMKMGTKALKTGSFKNSYIDNQVPIINSNSIKLLTYHFLLFKFIKQQKHEALL